VSVRLIRNLSFLTIVSFASGCAGTSGGTWLPNPPAGAAGRSQILDPARAGKQALLYVPEASLGDVLVYRYDDGNGIERIGQLGGFVYPAAPCTDKAGDVFIPDEEAAHVVEYAHGATSPQRVYPDPKAFPIACAVDPKSGKLAVVNFKTYGGDANVVVLDPRAPSVMTYTDANFATGASASYDGSGDLFVNGLDGQSAYELDELVAGTTQLTPLRIHGATMHVPGRLQWTGAHLLAGDQSYRGQDTSGAYRLLVSGTNATVDGSIKFTGTKDVAGFCKRGTGKTAKIVAADMRQNALFVYRFPSGHLVKRIDGPFTPDGAVISQAGQ
jgi:hypothetical protein